MSEPIRKSSEEWVAEELPRILPGVRAKSTPAVAEAPRPLDALVSLSGFSPQTTILACEVLRPERLILIGTEAADKSVGVITEYVRGLGLTGSRCKTETCDPSNPLDLYEKIRAALGPRRNAVIDFTGGKKVMSASAALVAWRERLPLCYVDSEYDPKTLRPVSGSEWVRLLPNPIAIFREEEATKANLLFRQGAYRDAAKQLAELAEAVREPARAKLGAALSRFYAAWCDLDLKVLADEGDKVLKALASPHHRAAPDGAARIEEQVRFAARLGAGGPSLDHAANFVLLGTHYEGQGRFDFSTLLYYRAVEACLQVRLAQRAPGFRCKSPAYEQLGLESEELLRRYNSAGQAVPDLKWRVAEALPRELALFQSAVLLAALDDLLVTAKVVNVNRIRRKSELRNGSILAHGYSSIGGKECGELKTLAQDMLQVLWGESVPGEDVRAILDRLQFLADLP